MPVQISVIGAVAAALLTAAIVAFITTPVVRTLAFRVGAVDVPRDNRRMHNHPIPRMGGLAIFFGFILSALIFVPLDAPLRGMLLGAVIIVILGIFDDIYALPALPKLLVQIAAATVAVLMGNQIEVLSNPNIFSSNPYWDLGFLSIPISVFWIVGITNAVNLIDGLDGLACGVSTISSMTMLVIALTVAEPDVALLMAALAGGCIGFLPYNLNPAKIFMGDTGSTFLGFILATVSIEGLFKSYAIISFAVPFLMLGPSSTPALPFCAGCPTARAPWPPTGATSTTGSSTWASTRSRRWRCSTSSAPSWACPPWCSPPPTWSGPWWC